MITNFRVGKGIGIVSDGTLALLEPMNGALAERLWALVAAGAGIDELLEDLSTTGLRSLGSFAMAQFEESGTRIVVRGSARASVTTSSGSREIAASGVRTWVEEVVEGVEALELMLGDAAGQPLPFRAEAGLLPADLLQRGRSERPQLSALATELVDDFQAEAIMLTPAPAPAENDPARTRMLHELHESPVPQALAGQASGINDALESAQDADDYDHIYGRTVARSVQSAAVFVESEQPADTPSSPLGDPPAELGTPEVKTAWQAPPAEPRQAISSVPLIQGIPGVQTPAHQQPGDHDGHTISRAQLQAMRAERGDSSAIPISAGSMGGPSVQALVCPNHHPNPPQLNSCRVCRAPLSSAPVLIARPALGVLKLGDGKTIVLDRPALIGRNPKVEGAIPNEIPNLVKLDVGHGLSRTHASIRLEGWQVLLEDLNSANGTIVRLPGREPRRLHPGEPVMLEPGSHIDFGGEVECTYEPV